MSSLPDPDQALQLAARSHEARMGFLRVELDLSATSLDMARVTCDPVTAQRNIALALRGYETVVRLYRPEECEDLEQQEIERKLEGLWERLKMLSPREQSDSTLHRCCH